MVVEGVVSNLQRLISFFKQSETMVSTWISFEGSKLLKTWHLLSLCDNILVYAEKFLFSLWDVLMQITARLELTLTLAFLCEWCEDSHLIDCCKVLSLLLMQSMDCFKAKKMYSLGWVIGYECWLQVESHFSLNLKHLFIFLVSGRSMFEIKHALRDNVNWFTWRNLSSF